MRPLPHPGLWLAVWIAGLLAVAAGSLMPATALPDAPQVSDKLVHALMYFALSAYAAVLFRRGRPLLLAAVFLFAWGFAIEIAQHTLTATRRFEWGDVWANGVGVVLGAGLGWLKREKG
ncbi:MAG: VanZ family protein [Lysobacteraceae bacterium]